MVQVLHLQRADFKNPLMSCERSLKLLAYVESQEHLHAGPPNVCSPPKHSISATYNHPHKEKHLEWDQKNTNTNFQALLFTCPPLDGSHGMS